MSKTKCSIKQAATAAQKNADAYARLVAHSLVGDALRDDGRKEPARLRTSERSAANAFKTTDRKYRACGRPVMLRYDAVELAQKHARRIAKRLKIKIAL